MKKKRQYKKITSAFNLNVNRLVRIMSFGFINSIIRYCPHEITADGRAKVVPSLGGIVFDYDLGDPVDKYIADHLQPGVTVSASLNFAPNIEENLALITYACIGNTITITDVHSQIRGVNGRIIGKHGGVNYLIVKFDKEILEQIGKNEGVKIELYGMGLRDEIFTDLIFMNIDPSILVKIPAKIASRNKVYFPVTKIIPAEAMGSGLGSIEAFSDYDVMSTNKEAERGLRIGDFVAIENHLVETGPAFVRGALTIGVVVHGSCLEPGHGPGVLPIISCKTGQLKTIIDKKSNLKEYI